MDGGTVASLSHACGVTTSPFAPSLTSLLFLLNPCACVSDGVVAAVEHCAHFVATSDLAARECLRFHPSSIDTTIAKSVSFSFELEVNWDETPFPMGKGGGIEVYSRAADDSGNLEVALTKNVYAIDVGELYPSTECTGTSS
jgi:hypothetical protein